MFVKKKEFKELKRRVKNLESGEMTIDTFDHGKRSVKWYIRKLCGEVNRLNKNSEKCVEPENESIGSSERIKKWFF